MELVSNERYSNVRIDQKHIDSPSENEFPIGTFNSERLFVEKKAQPETPTSEGYNEKMNIIPFEEFFQSVSDVKKGISRITSKESMNKSLKIFQYKFVNHAHLNDVRKLLPNVDIRKSKALAQIFGINEDPSKAENSKTVAYTISCYHFVKALIVNTSKSEGLQEERFSYAFRMLDEDDLGSVTREQIAKSMKFFAETNGFPMSNRQIDMVAEALLESYGLPPEGSLTRDVFVTDLHPEIHLNIENKGVSAGNSNRAMTVFSKISDKIADKNKLYKSIIKKIYYIRLNKKVIFWEIIYGCGNVGIAIGFWFNYNIGVAPVPWAKAMAGIICLNVLLLLLLMSKTFLRLLRKIPLAGRILPLDHTVFFHKIAGTMVLLAGVCHSIIHMGGTMVLISTSEDIHEFDDKFLHNFDYVPTYWELCGSLVGITGFVMLLIFFTIVFFAHGWFRRHYHEIFWYTHLIFPLGLILIHFHGSMQIVAKQIYWKICIAGGIIMLLEYLLKLYRFFFHCSKTISLKLVDEDVVELELKKPCFFSYESGQYVYINSPNASFFQWHPFTIASSPKEPTLKLVIAGVGYWTNCLVDEAKKLQSDPNRKSPRFFVDGPFGAPSQNVEEFEYVIVVCSGVGATPFSAVLKNIIDKKNAGVECRIKKLYFCWVNRNPQATKWLSAVLMNATKEAGLSNVVELKLFVTGANEYYDFRSYFLLKGLKALETRQRTFFEITKTLVEFTPTSKRSSQEGILTNNIRRTMVGDSINRRTFQSNIPVSQMYWGRPQWDEMFHHFAEEFKGKTVGVFLCCNQHISSKIFKCCHLYSSSETDTHFKYYKETFD